MHLSSLVVVAIFFLACEAVQLPKYIKPCRDDANFNKCGLQSGREAIKHLVSGDKTLRILPLSPLKLPFIQLENRADFQLNLTDVEVLGLDKAELVDFSADLKKHDIKVVVHLAELLLKGQFHADGRILILPIKGDGPGMLKVFGGNYTYSFHYDLIKKKEHEFTKIASDKFTFSIQHVEFNVDTVFGDNPTLGKQTTKFLNENWLEVIKDFEHVIGTTIARICRNIAGSMFERVPHNELVLS